IMLRPSGQLALIDFGTAREATFTYLAKIGGVGGVTQISSAGYTASEQERGFAIPQSDFYSLGMTFIHLVTGTYPLDMHDPMTDIYHWRKLAPQISDDFAQLLERLIAKRPVDRPPDCNAILHSLDEIDRHAKELQIEQQLQSKKQIQQAEKNRQRIWIGLVITLIGLAGYGIAISKRIIPSPIPLSPSIVQPK
ncbi:MAG: protein kinase, partial [Pseudanabaena sp.]